MSSPITGTGLTVFTEKDWSVGLAFQLVNGHLGLVKHSDKVWKPSQQLQAVPVQGSSVASVTYSGGKQIRIYYLDTNYIVQELCFTHGKGWYQGGVGKMKAKAVPGSGLAAVIFGALELGGGEPGDHIRVYYQESGTNIIKECANDGEQWYTGGLNVDTALGGTNLAAVAYFHQHETQLRVYYQARDLSLEEYGYNKTSDWFQGTFNPDGQATVQTSLSALAFGDDGEIQVYWRDVHGRIVFAKHTGAWEKAKVIEPIGSGYKFAVLQWEKGQYIRLYYQLFNGNLIEYCSDDRSKTWFQGQFKLQNNA